MDILNVGWPDNGPEPECPKTAWPWLDWAASPLPSSESLEALGEEADRLDCHELDERLRRVQRILQGHDARLGVCLRPFLDRRLYLAMGFRTASRYLRERLGVSSGRARALARLDRYRFFYPRVTEAYSTGKLSLVKCTALLSVVREETQEAWVERACSVTVRRLEEEIEHAIAVNGGPIGGEVVPPPENTRIEISRVDVPDLDKLDREDEERREAERKHDFTRLQSEPLDPVSARRQMRARYVDSEIVFSAPESVIGLFRQALEGFSDGTKPFEPTWRALVRLLEHVRAEWESQPRHRDPVFERDGWRCRVPGCTSRRNLHDHHVVFRSKGGKNDRGNRITVCAAHHLHGIHDGTVRVYGTAPDDLTWELGVRPNGPPLARFRGERTLAD